MITLTIPGFETLNLSHLVMDFNGTLACDGCLLDGVAQRVRLLSRDLEVTVLTADTFGHAAEQLEDLPLSLHLLGDHRQDLAKQDQVLALGASGCIAIGNGKNDALMLKSAKLGIALLQEEGLCTACLAGADILCRDINSALDLLLNPRRMIATLRS